MSANKEELKLPRDQELLSKRPTHIELISRVDHQMYQAIFKFANNETVEAEVHARSFFYYPIKDIELDATKIVSQECNFFWSEIAYVHDFKTIIIDLAKFNIYNMQCGLFLSFKKKRTTPIHFTFYFSNYNRYKGYSQCDFMGDDVYDLTKYIQAFARDTGCYFTLTVKTLDSYVNDVVFMHYFEDKKIKWSMSDEKNGIVTLKMEVDKDSKPDSLKMRSLIEKRFPKTVETVVKKVETVVKTIEKNVKTVEMPDLDALDRKTRNDALNRGKSCNWIFDSKDEAERIANEVWHIEECNMALVDGQKVNLQKPYARSQLEVNGTSIVLPIKKRLWVLNSFADRNYLGIPIIYE